MKNETKKSVLYLLLVMAVVIVMGVNSQVKSQPIVSPLPLSTAPVPEYTEPPLAGLPEQQKAKAIIARIWGKDVRVGLALSQCESGFRTEAVSKTMDYGLFQINQVHRLDAGDLENPVANTAFAYILYQKQGTNPWLSSRKCWSKLI